MKNPTDLFDEIFVAHNGTLANITDGKGHCLLANKIKDFISTHYVSKEKVREVLEGMKKEDTKGSISLNVSRVSGYNQALQDISKELLDNK